MTKLNPWLREKLRGLRIDPSLRVIVEVDPKHFSEVLSKLREMRLRIVSTAFDRFITVVVPSPQTLEDIERIPGVVEIHYDMPRGIYRPFGLIPALSIKDPLLGEVRLSSVEVPGVPIPATGVLPLPGIHRPGIEIIPTSESKRVVIDIETTLSGSGVKAFVLDTGINPFHPQIFPDVVEMYTTVPEPPFDFMGHGQWCSCMVYGKPFLTRFGVVEGIAPKSKKGHVKVLTTAGFGSDSTIIKGLEIALKRGAKVVSMSLGGPQQGPVDHDPLVKATKILHDAGVLIVVAAGNSGPSKWTIGSPGVSPWVLTVGSVSILDDLEVAWFSSRGPSGEWYKNHPSDWSEDYAKYGDLLAKPDVVAPGGGREDEETRPDEVLYNGCTGWFDGFYDLAIDGFEGMHGTCVVGDTMVKTNNGWIEIKDIEIGTGVVSAYVSENTARLELSNVSAKFTRPPTDVYVLKLPGRELWATYDHPVLVLRKLPYGYRFEWLTIEQLAKMQKYELDRIRVVAMRKAPTYRTDKTIGEEMAWLLGYFLGDGWVTQVNRSYMIAIADSYDKYGNSKPDVLRAIELMRKIFGLNIKLYKHRKGARYWRACSKKVGELLIKLGIAGKKAKEKTIPDWIFGLSKEEKLAFLEGLISADGSSDKRGRWRLETASKELAKKVQLLAIDLGANVTRVMSRTRRIRVPSTGREVDVTTYIVQIELPSLRRYRNITIGKSTYSAPSVAEWLDEHLDLRKIEAIEYVGREATYDITVVGLHSFIANGVVVHNSQATPHVAGLMALIAEALPSVTMDQIKAVLSKLGEKSDDTGWGLARLSAFARG